MTDETKQNGVNPADAMGAQQVAADRHMQSFIGPVYICAINGILRSMPGFPLDRLMIMVAGIMGKCVGEVLSIGDLGPVMKLRHLCAEEFAKQMKTVKIAPQQPQGMADPATAELLRKINH